ncbi:hypothetical protein PENSPDRAFT_426037 [Peniophora sp. CONT]|nr:hypothetical protein PENSPDRAFT_426037 [Peniophora sp. CONT]
MVSQDPPKPAHNSDPGPHGNDPVLGSNSHPKPHGWAEIRADVRSKNHTEDARRQRTPIARPHGLTPDHHHQHHFIRGSSLYSVFDIAYQIA